MINKLTIQTKNATAILYIALGLNETASIIDPESFKFWEKKIFFLLDVILDMKNNTNE